MKPIPLPRFLLLILLASCLAAGTARADGDDGDDVEVEGVIESLGAADVTVGGYTFTVTDDTEIRDDEGDIAFGDLEVGMFAEVRGHYASGGALVADRIEVEADGDDVEVEGLITGLGAADVTVGGLTFAITAGTEIRGEHGDDLAFEDLALGMDAEVRGHYAGDDLVAERIRVEDEGGQEVEVEGVIEALGPASVTVAGRLFLVTDGTEVEGDHGRPLTFADLAVGMFVEVRGFFGTGGALVAGRIEVEDFGDDEVEVTGAIEALTPDGLTVAGFSFAVTDQTVVLDHDHAPVPFSSLEVGLLVEVRGVAGAGGALTATRIQIEDGVEDEDVEAKAALDAVGPDAVVLLGRAFAVRPTTDLRGLDGQPIELGDLAAGDVVEVRARQDADGTLAALLVERDDTAADLIRLRAGVTAVGPASVEVLGVLFAVDGSTVIVGRDGAPLVLSDLAVGQRVRVDGVAEAGGARRATRVEVEHGARVAGRVAAVGGGTFTLPGVQVTTGAGTLYVDETGALVAASALTSGQPVRVVGAAGDAGTVAAALVVVFGGSTVGSEAGAPGAGFTLAPAAPNPFAGTTRLRFTVAAPAAVSVTVTDALGRTVRRLLDGPVAAGTHEVAFDAAGLARGVYFVRLAVDGASSAVQAVTVAR